MKLRKPELISKQNAKTGFDAEARYGTRATQMLCFPTFGISNRPISRKMRKPDSMSKQNTKTGFDVEAKCENMNSMSKKNTKMGLDVERDTQTKFDVEAKHQIRMRFWAIRSNQNFGPKVDRNRHQKGNQQEG